MKERSTAIYIGFIMVLSCLPYLNTLNGSFLLDEMFNIVKNPYIRSLDINFLKESFFNSEVYGTVFKGEIYRPLYIIFYAVEYKLWGLNVVGYHTVSLLLNAINSVAVYFLLNLMLNKKNVSFLGAILFALLPVHTENVSGIKEQTSLLSAFFFFLTITCYLKYRKSDSNRYLAASLILFAPSLLSRETAAALPLIIALIDILLFADLKISRVKRYLPWALFFTELFAFLWLRTSVLGQVAQQNYYLGDSLKATMFTMLRGFAYYIKLLLFPINLCGDYGSYPISYILDAKVAASAILLISILAAGLLLLRKRPLIAFGVLFFYVMLLPVSNIIPTVNIIAERFLYTPSFGLILVVTVLVRDSKNISKSILYPFLATAIILFSIITFNRNVVWSGQYAFWYDVIKKMPGSSGAHYQLALNMTDAQKRIEELKTALSLKPDEKWAVLIISALASTYAGTGDYVSASEHYNYLLKYKPDDRATLNNLGIAYYEKGDYQKAKEIFEGLHRHGDQSPKLLVNLGAVYDELKEYQKATSILNQAISMAPDYLDAYLSLGIMYNNMNRHKEAIAIYKKILDKDPEKAHLGAGETYFKMRDYISATTEFEKVVSINPKNLDAYYNLAYIYALRKDFQASLDWMAMAVGAGFKDFKLIEDDKAFGPVIRSERFNKLKISHIAK